jgi:hypothetical protein
MDRDDDDVADDDAPGDDADDDTDVSDDDAIVADDDADDDQLVADDDDVADDDALDDDALVADDDTLVADDDTPTADDDLVDDDAPIADDDFILIDDDPIADDDAMGDDAGPTVVERPDSGAPTPIDDIQPTTAGRVDLLFVIDNSISMGDKQQILAQALPDLVARLIDPVCESEAGAATVAVDGVCPAGFERQFLPVEDIHLGIVTSSMGAAGSATDCLKEEEGEIDNAHLLGSLPRTGLTTP